MASLQSDILTFELDQNYQTTEQENHIITEILYEKHISLFLSLGQG